MAVRDVFSVELVIQEEQSSSVPEITEDITSGILNVDIVTGNDIYEGPWQQIDTGEFTIVTRNPNMDPKVNPNVKYNARIKFNDSRTAPLLFSNTFFTGWITDVNVEYQRNDDPIITISGTDILGILQRTIVTQEMYDEIVDNVTTYAPELLETGIVFQDFCSYVEEFVFRNEPFNLSSGYKYRYFFTFISGIASGITNATPGSEGALAYRPAAYFPKVGETILEVINKYAQTNLDYLTIYNNEIAVFPQTKYNGAYWPPVQDPALEFPTYQFSSDPADNKPYQSILIDNGYNRTINQIEVSNESSFFVDGELQSETNSFGDYTIQESTQTWAATKARLETILDLEHANNEELQRYATDIFQVIAFPSDQIQNITFDNARFEDIQNDITRSFNVLNQFVRIKHQVNNTQTIDRFYDIAGITHSISPDEWVMGYTLKPSQQEIAFTYQGQVPTIQMNALTGDTNFNFTATVTDYPTEDIDYVLWDLNQIDPDSEVYYYPSAFSGEKFKNGLKRTGLTQTWNFDDDGILEPYGEDNPFGRIGAGTYWVTAYLFLKNGFTIAVQQEITVGVPEVTADFLWTQNLTNNFGQVSFTNTSYNHETGEPDSYAWDFGNGVTSALENPVIVYDPSPSTTTYSVSLTVFTYGEEFEKIYNTHTETVTLVQPTMTANFTSSANGSVVTFTNTSTNVGFEEPDAYLWDFGDGTSSTLKNPVKTYAGAATVPLTFSVTLTTRNIWEQTATVTKNVTIAALYNTGTLPVTQVRISSDGPSPMMSYLRCLRSDGANLSLNATTTRANDAGEVWWQYPGATGDYQNPPLTGTGLTRNILLYPNEGGLQFRGGGANTIPAYSLNTTIPSTLQISNINMRFDDIFPAGVGQAFYRQYVSANDSFGGFYPIGYWELPPIPNFAPRQGFGRDYTMTAIRPMPPTIPYFKYTFNNTTVSFTSVETADSYAWTFGDGTTSTAKNPVKTYAARGTYTVTLAVTNGGVVTRTTTEPVIVESLAAYPVRYIKFAQKEHTGTFAFDTPGVSALYPIFNKNTFQQTNPVPDVYLNPINIAKAETYSMNYVLGTGTTIINPITSPYNTVLYQGTVRAQSLDATFRTKWELVGDLGTSINNITGFQVDLTRSPTDGNPAPSNTTRNYEMYVTNYVGTPAGIGSATWTKIGEFNASQIPSNTQKTYYLNPS